MNDLEILFAIFNQYLFQDAKNLIKDLKIYYSTTPKFSDNALIDQLLGAVENYSLENIDLPLFQSILSKTGKNEEEKRVIMNKIIEYKKFNKVQIAPLRKTLVDLVASIYIRRANSIYQDSPSEYLSYLKGLTIKMSDNDYLVSKKFSELDVNSMVADTSVCGPKSCFEWINETFLPERSYPSFGLQLVSMPPGCGKTLWSMQECLNFCLQQRKCHYLCMGDMDYSDFIIRMAAQYLGVDFCDVKQNFAKCYEMLNKAIGNYLDITIVPASTISVDEYIEFMKTNGKSYEICFIDYDSQFLSTVGSDSMYLVYGEIYAKLSELTLVEHKLIFILAQPMKAAWSLPVIELDQVGESARKIHAADWCITRGREPGNVNGLGTQKIVKNRRGEDQVVDYNIRLSNGRFKSLPKSIYEDLKLITEKRKFTEGELDAMIENYEKQVRYIKDQLAQQGNSRGGTRTPKSPFSK